MNFFIAKSTSPWQWWCSNGQHVCLISQFESRWSLPSFSLKCCSKRMKINKVLMTDVRMLLESACDCVAGVSNCCDNNAAQDTSCSTCLQCFQVSWLLLRFLTAIGWEPWSSGSKGFEFDSRHRILDGHFSQLFVVNIVMCVWKDKNK